MRKLFHVCVGLGFLAAAGLAGVAHADVTNASVFEQVDADAINASPFLNTDDNHTNITLPPTNLSAEAEQVNAGGTASITINAYSGPLNAADSTAGLDLNVSLAAEADAIAPQLSSSLAELSFYTFTLTASQPYTYSKTGTLAVTTLTGPGGVISPGSGMLLPGQYTINSTFQGGPSEDLNGDGFHLQVTAVPEPAATVLAGMSLVMLISNRRAVRRD
ncbi:MAG TPA: hypothetical protein VKK61_09300 [Tepidisphaeraceae bacterium]|nr:hypothetical protein [Tepidisphaeraceae bacterium]